MPVYVFIIDTIHCEENQSIGVEWIKNGSRIFISIVRFGKIDKDQKFFSNEPVWAETSQQPL